MLFGAYRPQNVQISAGEEFRRLSPGLGGLLQRPRSRRLAHHRCSERLPARYAARGEQDQGPLLESFLADRGTNASELIVDILAQVEVEVEACLRRGGLGDADVASLRRRLVG